MYKMYRFLHSDKNFCLSTQVRLCLLVRSQWLPYSLHALVLPLLTNCHVSPNSKNPGNTPALEEGFLNVPNKKKTLTMSLITCLISMLGKNRCENVLVSQFADHALSVRALLGSIHAPPLVSPSWCRLQCPSLCCTSPWPGWHSPPRPAACPRTCLRSWSQLSCQSWLRMPAEEEGSTFTHVPHWKLTPHVVMGTV